MSDEEYAELLQHNAKARADSSPPPRPASKPPLESTKVLVFVHPAHLFAYYCAKAKPQHWLGENGDWFNDDDVICWWPLPPVEKENKA